MVLELTAGAAAAGDGCAQRERERVPCSDAR